MLDYLMNYGVEKHSLKYEEIDINDRLVLGDQINRTRKDYISLLNLLDNVNEKYLKIMRDISKRSKTLISKETGSKNRNVIFSLDEEYLNLEAESQALKTGMSMINAQIDFYKNDLRILNSVFYNKF